MSEGNVGSTTQELGGPERDPDDLELGAEKVRVKAVVLQVMGVWKRTRESESVVPA